MPRMVLEITNLHILRYLPTCWLFLLERYTIDNQRCTHTAKGIAIPEEPQYYTVAEAMEKFNLTRDQLYHYAKYHNIPKVKKGKYTFISKPELDKLLAAPKIE